LSIFFIKKSSEAFSGKKVVKLITNKYKLDFFSSQNKRVKWNEKKFVGKD